MCYCVLVWYIPSFVVLIVVVGMVGIGNGVGVPVDSIQGRYYMNNRYHHILPSLTHLYSPLLGCVHNLL